MQVQSDLAESGHETTEYSTFQRFLALQSNRHLHERVPRACSTINRHSCKTAALDTSLAGLGCPVVITDAFSNWPAIHKWTLDFFRQRHGQLPVRVNSRAPARHADALPGGGGTQKTVLLPLATYVDYMEERSMQAAATTAPFYLNGWAAFHEVPALAEDCPSPAFLEGVDHTAEILRSLDKALCHTGFGGSGKADDDSGQLLDICSITGRLKKVFMGPPGTITRLHYDAGSAHGYIGQVMGRKLFVLFSPSDTPYLYRLPSEVETVQSAVDPLDPDTLVHLPLYAHASPVAFVLHPGEAAVIPQGWWHYAVALDVSVTVMQNFYHAPTNAKGLLALVLQSLVCAKGINPAQLLMRIREASGQGAEHCYG